MQRVSRHRRIRPHLTPAHDPTSFAVRRLAHCDRHRRQRRTHRRVPARVGRTRDRRVGRRRRRRSSSVRRPNQVIVLAVAAAAAVGAPARYLLDVWVIERTGGVFPWGTFAVNVIGSFALGLLAAAPSTARTVVGDGICGAFTTFSTLSYETVRLAEDGSYLEA